MKSLACVCFALLIAPVANAQRTIDLPSPILNQHYPATTYNCHYQARAHTESNGFSADRNYVLGISHGYLACGHSGRGADLVYTYYCMSDVWDLSGNLVSVKVLPYAGCPVAHSYRITDAAGYTVYTVTNVYYGYISSQYAVLVTP
jgi:hypothetical protein